MKKTYSIGLAVTAVISFVSLFIVWVAFMHTETVEPGHELVIVDKPYIWGHEGVRSETLKEGRILLFRTSEGIPVKMVPQSVPVKFDDFSSSDNILLDFESTIQYKYTDAVSLIKNFGTDWFENNVLRQYTAIVREAIKKKTMTQMMSDPVAAQAVDGEVTEALQKLVAESKLPITVLGVSLGRAKPNQNVLEQMNQTAAEQQRERTMVAAERAEISRKREQIAKAEADNAYRNEMQLSPQMFLELERIKLFAQACAAQGNICVVPAHGGQVNINTGK